MSEALLADVLDVISLVLLVAGSGLCLTSAIGVVRFPDLLTRMHAAAKPQVLGLLLVLVGIGMRVQEWGAVGLLVLIALFQYLTIPVAAQMLARAAHRTRRDEDHPLTEVEEFTRTEPPTRG